MAGKIGATDVSGRHLPQWLKQALHVANPLEATDGSKDKSFYLCCFYKHFKRHYLILFLGKTL